MCSTMKSMPRCKRPGSLPPAPQLARTTATTNTCLQTASSCIQQAKHRPVSAPGCVFSLVWSESRATHMCPAMAAAAVGMRAWWQSGASCICAHALPTCRCDAQRTFTARLRTNDPRPRCRARATSVQRRAPTRWASRRCCRCMRRAARPLCSATSSTHWHLIAPLQTAITLFCYQFMRGLKPPSPGETRRCAL